MENQAKHILALSGGKDSSALAIYMLDKGIDMEYVFCDTEKELDETYEYLTKLESYLGKKIIFLKYADGYGFDEILQIKNGFLPSPESRWCTEYLKLKPYEQYIADNDVISYVGIRADEPHRKGYISTKPNIKTVFPFVEDNIRREDVIRILNDSGLGVPEYYQWRSRSGCFFCFFQQKREWVGLLENHPELYAKAMEYEKHDPVTGVSYTWMQNESLKEFSHPDRVAQIKAKDVNRKIKKNKSNLLVDILSNDEDCEDNGSCLLCHL
ncbi:MAG: phosphoadenosine phosphosulfate reductase family protein [Candidatus Cloacimonetes bacterium]|jgi:3'-phosphoadenosine 5'-phosphosulfate sulfotransferase (PAPS reductase)/FAD synthetase|nr:phosphoadenosine phosphosulfate reductase family protein [Candidatus Cloacimonadota bacterium]